MRELEIKEEPIELYKILKFENMVNSGGEAKYVISQGQVMVNGEVETRKRGGGGGEKDLFWRYRRI